MKITIIITTCNRKHTLEKVLASLEGQVNPNIEINIMDDNSTDGTMKFCENYVLNSNFKFKYIRLNKRGYNLPVLRNIGVNYAVGDFLIFLDDDIIVDHNFIEEYINHFNRNRNTVFLGKILFVKSSNLSSILLEDIKHSDFHSIYEGLYSEQDFRNERFKDMELFYKVWGGNLGMSKNIFQLLNGFDEDFKSWGGLDSDFGIRLIRAGIPIELVNNCIGYHLGTEFKSLSEIENEAGVRMFKEKKIKDLSFRRNLKNSSKFDSLLKVVFDETKYK